MIHASQIAAAIVTVTALAGSAAAREPGSEYAPEERASSYDDGPPLVFGREFEIGGYAGLDVAYTRMFGQDGAVVGLQGALLLDHHLSIGLAGYGWTNPQEAPPNAFGEPQRFETGYGGVTVRYSLYAQHMPVYLTVGTLIGGGAIALQEDDDDDRYDGFDEGANDDLFTVVQPDVTLHANLTPWLRLGLTAGYRFTSGIDHYGYDESDVNGFLVGGQVQFGRF